MESDGSGSVDRVGREAFTEGDGRYPRHAALLIHHLDDQVVVVHKPPNLLVHRSPIASRETEFLLQRLRDQIGRRVYPVHRLDRATSGLMVFGLSPETARELVAQFEARTIGKEYRALARGWVNDAGTIDHPVADDDGNGVHQDAVTRYRCLQRVELPVAVDRYATSRYSLVAVIPETGRRQQIRKHFKHISHHLIGDTTHGNGKQNQFFRERYGIHRLMLMSQHLAFDHPGTGCRLAFDATPEPEWERLAAAFGWDLAGSSAE